MVLADWALMAVRKTEAMAALEAEAGAVAPAGATPAAVAMEATVLAVAAQAHGSVAVGEEPLVPLALAVAQAQQATLVRPEDLAEALAWAEACLTTTEQSPFHKTPLHSTR